MMTIEKRPRKILVVDDHPIVLQGVQLLFKDHPKYEVCQLATSVEEAISVCNRESIDLIILDVNLKGKNSLDSVDLFKKRFPSIKILIFTSYDTPGIVKKALSSGVNGYLLKDASHSEWMEALDTVFVNKTFISHQIDERRKSPVPILSSMDKFNRIHTLTDRERRIIECIVKGMQEQAIAEFLFISKNTVHTHKKNIMRKLSLHSTTEIVRFAYENELN